MEIGFNAGHSAEVLLQNNPSVHLTSFDLCGHEYVAPAKEIIDAAFPGRHKLVAGDSTATIPTYIEDNPETKFDVIFIDGGHDYDVAAADLRNCARLAHKDTIVIMDDTMFTRGWEMAYTVGPTRAWAEALAAGTLVELGRRDYEVGRGMAWGRYATGPKP
jgi:predicted O-methyltransferase YrrM